MSRNKKLLLWVMGALLAVAPIAAWAATRTAEACSGCCCPGMCPLC
jgi:hypothetical protein